LKQYRKNYQQYLLQHGDGLNRIIRRAWNGASEL